MLPGESFNPHPPVRASATIRVSCHRRWMRVSILTHPSGRVQRGCACIVPIPESFNPHPPVRASATMQGGNGYSFLMFQSSPTRQGECNYHLGASKAVDVMFQSSPTRQGECNADMGRIVAP